MRKVQTWLIVLGDVLRHALPRAAAIGLLLVLGAIAGQQDDGLLREVEAALRASLCKSSQLPPPGRPLPEPL